MALYVAAKALELEDPVAFFEGAGLAYRGSCVIRDCVVIRNGVIGGGVVRGWRGGWGWGRRCWLVLAVLKNKSDTILHHEDIRFSVAVEIDKERFNLIQPMKERITRIHKIYNTFCLALGDNAELNRIGEVEVIDDHEICEPIIVKIA